jgi:DNA-binding NarL/FixJ family response regulator
VVAQQLKSRSLSESDRWRSSDVTGQGLPVAIAILSADPSVRGRFEQLPQGDRTVTVAGVVRHASDLRSLVGRQTINIAVMDNPTDEQLNQWKEIRAKPPLLVLLHAGNRKNVVRAFEAGATAVLDRSAARSKIIAAITAATNGLVVLEPEHLGYPALGGLIEDAPGAAQPIEDNGTGPVRLTPRELDVLAAMADGASNKAIARRLNISFSTVKFHVASILAKLDADSRTEAVMKAAQSGFVML